MDIDDVNNADDDDNNNFDHIPAKSTFTCLADVDLLRAALGISGTKFSVIVIREEYKFLRELLEEGDKPFIVTGQPGTGGTVFLLYLLIYRLQLALPTAVQFLPNVYIVFRVDGMSVCPTNDEIDFDHRSMLPPGCWCLSDGNAKVMDPCMPFQRNDLRTFLITSAGLNEYNKWRMQAAADTVITALPRAVEVAAIAKMAQCEPRDAVSIMRKWGPCTRTVLTILRRPHEENNLRRYAIDAVIDIYNDPSRVSLRDIGQLPSGEGSTLLFVHPIRCKDKPAYGDSRFIIPTTHLSEIFDAKCQGLSTQSRMKLQELFSMYAMTRSPAGWLHEKSMHLQMMATGSKRYEIFNDNVKYHMNSAGVVPVGTASGFRDAAHKTSPSFYWFPSVVDWPGIDGVLVNGNDIYALQASIADTHRCPHEGLEKVWQTIGVDYATDLGTRLPDVALGRRLHIKVSARTMLSAARWRMQSSKCRQART
ncbi:hypothetical protein M378DRAFT_313137 [Amanita muscaria Koide BX008]|uniref:Uncharacterized protein n=1 Tax=Amanita muscaria (strain Koide BX008) TaxID=946122 RepID=A0A0C2S747_AMAMK|nr:hypothetical protein M378DRAFT_313137 [Amanita muscaria Koide BX008]